MKLDSLLAPGQIVLGLQSSTLAAAVEDVLEGATGHGLTDCIPQVIQAVLEREAQASTAAENGVALPHARLPDLADVFVFLGVAVDPLAEEGMDGRAVDLVFLVVTTAEKPVLMLQLCSAIARLSQHTALLDGLRQAQSSDAAWRLIHEAGVELQDRLLARDFMREARIIARVDMTLHEILEKMIEHKQFYAPVCDEGEGVVGLITSAEVVQAGFPEYLASLSDISFLDTYEPFEEFFEREAQIPVGEVLHADPLIIEADTPLIQVIFCMRADRCRLAIVTEQGRFAGIIERNNLLRRLLRP
jgi:mannitol/fructose-specific phosphotransferase system IIA component (Ntr-type)/CBS domain-containing protein